MLQDMDPLLFPMMFFILPCYLISLILFFIVRNRTSGIVRFKNCFIIFLTGVAVTSFVATVTFVITFMTISFELVSFVCAGTLLISTPQILDLLSQLVELRRAKISAVYF